MMRITIMQDSVNLFEPSVRANPYPTYGRLRLGAPAQQIQPGGFWAVSRYEDVERVLKNPAVFSSTGFGALFKPDWLPHNPIGDSVLTKDGVGHAKLRALVSHMFAPRAVAHLEPRIRAIATELAARLVALGQTDVVDTYCAPLPGRVMAEALGLDPTLQSKFKRWVNDVTQVSHIYPGDAHAAAVRASVAEMEGHLRGVLAARRREPGDDPVSALVRAKVGDNVLTDEELVAFLFLLVPAGFETTMHMFSLMMLDFAQHPDQFARLREDRSRIPAYVDEVLRKEPPVHGVMRMTAADTELGGVKIPGNSMVLVLLGSANHDESRFPEPQRFDPARGSTGGLAFGHGSHFCLGAPLVRLEARIAIEELTTRIAGFEKLPGEIEWNVAFHVRGPVALPFRVLPAQTAK